MNLRPIAILAACSSLLGCSGGQDDAYRRDPSTARLSISEAVPHPTALGEPRHIYLQLVVDRGMWCDDDLEGEHCEDPAPSVSQDFEIVEAVCPGGTCEIVRIDRTLGHLVELTVVPRASSARLSVKARAGDGEGSVEAVAEYRVECSD